MNWYEERIAQLDKDKLPKQIFGDGRNIRMTNEEFWKKLKVGDKIYPTVWYLRNVYNVGDVAKIAEEGLTIIEKGHINDPEGKWGMFGWEEKRFDVLWFDESEYPMSFKYSIAQQIWKINDEILGN